MTFKFNIDWRFLGLIQGDINFERVETIHNSQPIRICFKTTHEKALKESSNGEYLGSFNVPFKETIKPIFEKETELTLFPANAPYHGFWRSFKRGDADDIQTTKQFISKYNEIVFVKDTLALSASLGENMFWDEEIKDFSRTVLGELEYKAKYENCEDSKIMLAEIVEKFVVDVPFYKDADFICAVPPSEAGKSNLPYNIIKLIEENVPQENISDYIKWNKEKPSLKELGIQEKWTQLENVGMQIEQDLKGKSVILLDDLYQSGTTMQFVAMKLIEKGASYIFGLTLVKSLRNTDNLN